MRLAQTRETVLKTLSYLFSGSQNVKHRVEEDLAILLLVGAAAPTSGHRRHSVGRPWVREPRGHKHHPAGGRPGCSPEHRPTPAQGWRSQVLGLGEKQMEVLG